MINHARRFQGRHGFPIGSKGHKNAGNARRARCAGVRFRITQKHRWLPGSASVFNRQKKGRRIGLADRQCIAAHKAVKKLPAAQFRHQLAGEPHRFVGADCRGKAKGPQPRDRVERARIETAVPRNIGLVETQGLWIRLLNSGRGISDAQPFEPQPQHGAGAAKGSARIAQWVKLRRVALGLERGISRRDQVLGGVRQCAVQIENDRRHTLPHRLKPGDTFCDRLGLAY